MKHAKPNKIAYLGDQPAYYKQPNQGHKYHYKDLTQVYSSIDKKPSMQLKLKFLQMSATLLIICR